MYFVVSNCDVYYLSHCSNVCNIMLYWTALKRQYYHLPTPSVQPRMWPTCRCRAVPSLIPSVSIPVWTCVPHSSITSGNNPLRIQHQHEILETTFHWATRVHQRSLPGHADIRRRAFYDSFKNLPNIVNIAWAFFQSTPWIWYLKRSPLKQWVLSRWSVSCEFLVLWLSEWASQGWPRSQVSCAVARRWAPPSDSVPGDDCQWFEWWASGRRAHAGNALATGSSWASRAPHRHRPMRTIFKGLNIDL